MGSGPYLQWDQVGSTAYGNIHLELDFYVDRGPTTEEIWLLQLVVSQQHTVLITVNLGTGRATLAEHVPPGTMTINHRFGGNQDATIQAQAWTHVAIDLALVSGGTSSAEVAINGVVQTPDDGGSLAASWVPGTLSLQVGYPYMYSSAPRRTYFDNVLLYAQ
jgi:hypothetical protein